MSELVKHSVWGWNRGDGDIAPAAKRGGHTYDSVRTDGTFFPQAWSDQDIADAITETIENPEYIERRVVARRVYREIGGVMVRVEWAAVPQRAIKPTSAYPIFGEGVEKYSKKEKQRVSWKTDAAGEMSQARRVTGERIPDNPGEHGD